VTSEGFSGDATIDYETVVLAVRKLIGQRVAVRVESSDPGLPVAEFVGVLSGAHPQATLEAGGAEEGVIFTVETAPDRHPDSEVGVWTHPTGVGLIDDDSVAWRVGSVAVIIERLADV